MSDLAKVHHSREKAMNKLTPYIGVSENTKISKLNRGKRFLISVIALSKKLVYDELNTEGTKPICYFILKNKRVGKL